MYVPAGDFEWGGAEALRRVEVEEKSGRECAFFVGGRAKFAIRGPNTPKTIMKEEEKKK